VNYGATGNPEISRHYYQVDGHPKRFFDESDINNLFHTGWTNLEVREVAIDRYEKSKKIWEIVGRKGMNTELNTSLAE